ncbi:MAG: uncharacterized protein QOK31_1963 [Solirubrobacteraceae bacterium]|jgi:dienelactone hydrolase|nr:uncharacterized protein [Solirubrobacteraceae bacterium]
MARTEITFDSSGERCAAWLYRPDGAAPTAPWVVLAHGWAGTRDARLDAFAERFVAAGLGALVFDYRHFGASEGEPRQLLDIRRQLADWSAAIAYVRGLEGVDPERVALWGTSFGGGHVITSAAGDSRLAAVVAHVPFADGLRNLPRLGASLVVRLVLAGLRDQLGALLRRPPHMMPAVGPPGSLGVMTSPDAEPGYLRIVPAGSRWRNETAARIALRIASYRPGRKAKSIRCPILFAIADDDAVTPPEFALDAAAAAPRSEVKRYPGGHFDLYVGEGFERSVADETEFLTRHLK